LNLYLRVWTRALALLGAQRARLGKGNLGPTLNLIFHALASLSNKLFWPREIPSGTRAFFVHLSELA
jgi:hypothetical protein